MPSGSVGGSERLRLFCALRLPAGVGEELAAWAERELHGGRVVPLANLHVTLAFLGSRPSADLEVVGRELHAAAAAAERPVLTVRRYREGRSAGMLTFEDEGGRAAALAADVAERLERAGIHRREARSWLPHVTVVRFSRERPRLRPPLPALGPFSPSDAAAYLSRLRPGGAEYEVVESFALGG